MNLKSVLNKRHKVSYVRNSGRKHPFLTSIKKTKETKNFSDIGFISIITKNAKLKFL